MANIHLEKEFLAKLPLFDGCTQDLPSLLLTSPAFLKKQYEKGDRVAYDGGALGILYEGRLQIGAGQKADKVTLNRLLPGAVFGFSSLFAEGERFETNIHALSKTTVFWIPETLFGELMKTEPHLARNVISVQSEKIRFLNERIRFYTAPTAEEKVYTFLKKLPEENGVRILPCRMASLASRLGIGRASLYRAFEKLIEEKKIEKNGNQVVLTEERGMKS